MLVIPLFSDPASDMYSAGPELHFVVIDMNLCMWCGRVRRINNVQRRAGFKLNRQS